MNNNVENKQVQLLTAKLRFVLNSENVSEDIQSAIEHILTDAANIGGVGITSPEIISVTLPFIFGQLSPNYAAGVIDSIKSIFDSGVFNDEVESYLEKIHIEHFPNAYETSIKPENQCLDLSSCSIEDLSVKLSDILKNPNLPPKLHGVITDQIYQETEVDPTDPKTIESALKQPAAK